MLLEINVKDTLKQIHEKLKKGQKDHHLFS